MPKPVSKGGKDAAQNVYTVEAPSPEDAAPSVGNPR